MAVAATGDASTPYQATPDETNRALGAAQVEAWTTSVSARETPSSVPPRIQYAFAHGVGLAADDNAKVRGGWPEDIGSVEYSSMTRGAALEYVDGSTTDSDQNVVVIRLTGHFAVATTGPGDAVVTGTTETIVVDPETGVVIDFGLTATPKPLPTRTVLFG